MSNSNSRASLVVGLALVGLGVLFLLQQFFDFNFWGALWPLLIIGAGGLLFVAAMLGGRESAPLFIPGSIVTMVGAILFVLNLTDRWEAWSYAWTLIIAAVGVGLWLHGVRAENAELRRRGQQTLQTGLVMLLIFGAFFELVVFGSGRTANWAGPVLLIALGAFLLLPNNRDKEKEA
jgi:hypothetical protein